MAKRQNVWLPDDLHEWVEGKRGEFRWPSVSYAVRALLDELRAAGWDSVHGVHPSRGDRVVPVARPAREVVVPVLESCEGGSHPSAATVNPPVKGREVRTFLKGVK